MSHPSDLSTAIDETITAMLRTQATAHTDIAATLADVSRRPGPQQSAALTRAGVHAELAHRYAILARRVETGAVDYAAEETVAGVMVG